MEREHLLPLTSHRRRSSLSSLPENNEISFPLPFTPSQLKHHLIFGPCCSSLPSTPILHHYPFSPPSFHDVLPKEPTFSCSSSPNSPSSSSSSSDDQTHFDELPSGPPSDITSLPWPKSSLHRAKTAPAMAVINDFNKPSLNKPPQSSSQATVRQGILLLVIYLSLGVVIYFLNRSHFVVNETHPVVDALYFCIVTMCTIGYGDIIPNSTVTKLFSIMFVLVGFGFIDILLSGMVCYVLDLQESYLLKNIKGEYYSGSNRRDREKGGKRSEIIFDVKKGRMRIRMKVALALGVVILCIGMGAGVMHFVEKLGWLDSFYLSVMSVTTVGYGDQAFHSLHGRMFACIWLLVSTLAVARAFLYLAEARVDKRNRRLEKWVLAHDMTVSEFLAADTDNNGFVSKSEYVVYKLKEMGKVAEKDIMEICQQFDRLDGGHCGKITLTELSLIVALVHSLRKIVNVAMKQW